MEKIVHRYKVLIVSLAVVAALVHFLEYDTYHASAAGVSAIENIPEELSGWKGRDVELGEDIYEILETRSVIHRVYIKDDSQVFLSIVHYPETKVDFHAPEACLGGKGIKIVKSTRNIAVDLDDRTKSLEINQLLYDRETGKDLVYYFFKAGDFMGASYIKLRFELAMNKLGASGKSGTLIRLSTPMGAPKAENPDRLMTEFLSEMLPYIDTYL